MFSRAEFPEALMYYPDTKMYKSAWMKTIDAAEAYNDPGRFTAFIGYEWTSQVPPGQNLHRVVVYRDDADQARQTVPATTYPPQGSTDPEYLWQLLQDYEDKTGGEVLAIAHNGNLSNGLMFPEVNPVGEEPLTRLTPRPGPSGSRSTRSPRSRATERLIPSCRRTTSSPISGPGTKGNLNLSELKTDDMLVHEYARSGLQLGLRLERQARRQPVQVRHDRLDRQPHGPGDGG